MKTALSRVFSIDVFRALTMFLMIFVNDLWTLSGIPLWLEHSEAHVDFLGFADTIFPCFLFILGMSVPLAIQKRLSKGDTKTEIIKHIIIRSAALLIMGVFTVNVPEINTEATGLSSAWFQILMVSGFFLIWNVYPENVTKTVRIILQVSGAALLILLAVIFRAGEADSLKTMTPQWWGILGLIGWSYLTCALLYLFTYKNTFALIASAAFFLLINIAGHSGWLKQLWPDGPGDWILGNGAFHIFTFAGILATLVAAQYQPQEKQSKLPLVLIGIGVVVLISGLFARNFFIISKIYATPTWVLICSGIAYIAYGIIYYITDIRKKANWFDSIKTAGTSTLTCYLIPYIYYSVGELVPLELPESLKTGGVGLIKSILFAFLIIWITKLLCKIQIKLKI